VNQPELTKHGAQKKLRICGAHFTENDYFTGHHNRSTLKHNSVPTIEARKFYTNNVHNGMEKEQGGNNLN